MNRVKFGAIAVLLIGIGLAVGGYFGYRSGPGKTRTVEVLSAAADCRVTEARCEASGSSALVSLMFDGPVTPMSIFGVDVGVAGLAPERVDSVRLAFEMAGMDMGQNRYLLKPVTLPAGMSHWQTQAMLPVCTTGRRDWLAIVTVVVGGEEYVAEFAFTASPVR